MTRARKAKGVRVSSHRPPSLVRTRTSRKKKSRKRATPVRLAAKLKAARELLGMSQGQIAEAVGVDNRASISGYERGEREPPLPVLLKYARLAKLPIEYFVDDEIAVQVLMTK